MRSNVLSFVILFSITVTVNSQGFLHRDNQKIVDGAGAEVILRGAGLGGWMLQEGYMLQTNSFANAQYEIRDKIEQLVGPINTENFYTAWLENYCQKADIDSLAAWGFNSIRLPMHYNLFTLPIEDEPVAGEQTWLDTGFELTDKLLDWCEANEIYLILDLHAAPGGQGKDAAISDYNPSKPSLWENSANQVKTVALWRQLAERYANEPWIGGYDLLNEVNWDMAGNVPLKNLYFQITNAIREVDRNHIIFIEGNWWANDFTGLTPPWDDNMVYSFHKYWSFNDQASIQWMLDMRNTYNIPIWCGESGENSNVWFTNAIKLFEKNGIGWAWWPYKKVDSISGTLSVTKNPGYQSLLNYWEGNGSQPSVAVANQALMQLADDLKLANCNINNDVIDAMIRQVASVETRPFKKHKLPGVVFASDYDFGSNGFAYFDQDTADFHVSTGTWTGWNSGWAYRNDGVDIGPCEDNDNTNGFNIGWVETDEWLKYTVEIEQSGTYDFNFRMASEVGVGIFHLELDGRNVSGPIEIPNTGSWQTWRNVPVNGVPLEAGTHRLKVFFDKAGGNLNYFEAAFTGQPIEFKILGAETSTDGTRLLATLSKKMPMPLASTAGFTIRFNGILASFSHVELDSSGYILQFNLGATPRFTDEITLSYAGESLLDVDGIQLPKFFDFAVRNNVPDRQMIPGKIEAEDFDENNGFGLEGTSDTGGGENLGWSDRGDYVDYNVIVPVAGTYTIRYRFSALNSGSKLIAEYIKDEKTTLLHLVTFPATAGWQNWQIAEKEAQFPAGEYVLRLRVLDGGFNLNWFETIKVATSVDEKNKDDGIGESFQLQQNFPNPFNPTTTIAFSLPKTDFVTLNIFNALGQRIETLIAEKKNAGNYHIEWHAGNVPSGTYFYRLQAGGAHHVKKLILKK
ncbi:MAG: T9SS C-terminal target domain-containing protein [Calditrichaeota bacterium]|nr:MAG: T9SS C-terminal target domain-containing protein [Calditrichota bacterium]